MGRTVSSNSPSSAGITGLLKAWSSGDQAALARLAEREYPELRLMARRYMKNERQANTLQTTALVHEVSLRLVDVTKVEWHERAQFFAMAAQMMRRILSLPAGRRITNRIAHDIWAREGVAATIDGSVESLGKAYVITLQAITCQGGATLAREQIQAGDKEHVLNALGTAATAMRAKLGESLNSIQKLNRPLEQATTPSLEALQNYTAGYSEMIHGQFIAAFPFFERATSLDPNFAMAYFFRGVAFENAGDLERSREYTQKALVLIDRVSEYERDLITGTYYSYVGQSDKAVEDYRLGIRDYPRAWGFHNQLSVEYIDQGQFEEGLKEGQEATGLQANVEPPYRRQLDAYMCLDRLAEAKQLAEKLRAQGLGGARIHQRFLEIAYVEGDDAAAAREIQWFAGKPVEYLSFGLQAAKC